MPPKPHHWWNEELIIPDRTPLDSSWEESRNLFQLLFREMANYPHSQMCSRDLTVTTDVEREREKKGKESWIYMNQYFTVTETDFS